MGMSQHVASKERGTKKANKHMLVLKLPVDDNKYQISIRFILALCVLIYLLGIIFANFEKNMMSREFLLRAKNYWKNYWIRNW
jgi:hypothetical protein